MIIRKTYRDNGAIGALLDEYENVIDALKKVISEISNEQLIRIVDHETKDEDCRSIQTILTHVVQSGYTYVVEIRKSLGEECDYKEKLFHLTIEEYLLALDEMFSYNLLLFEDHPKIKMIEFDNSKKINARWGQYYDVEQLMAHAIVHIMRHRRQIERFMLKI